MTKFKTDKEMLEWLLFNSQLNTSGCTPYKHKPAYYMKKSHYINGKKVNRNIYKEIKEKQDELFKKTLKYKYLDNKL